MSISQEMAENIQQLSYQEDRYKNNEFRVSELVFCPAKAYYYRKTSTRPRLNGKMLSGQLFHKQLPFLLKGIKEFENAEYEVECKKEHKGFDILGHCDVLTSKAVYEAKFTGTNLDRYGCPAHYILQANCYATLLNRKNFALIIVNSQNLSTTVIPGKQDDAKYKVLLDRAKVISASLKVDTPPKGPAYQWECRFCNLKAYCKNFPGDGQNA